MITKKTQVFFFTHNQRFKGSPATPGRVSGAAANSLVIPAARWAHLGLDCPLLPPGRTGTCYGTHTGGWGQLLGGGWAVSRTVTALRAARGTGPLRLGPGAPLQPALPSPGRTTGSSGWNPTPGPPTPGPPAPPPLRGPAGRAAKPGADSGWRRLQLPAAAWPCRAVSWLPAEALSPAPRAPMIHPGE